MENPESVRSEIRRRKRETYLQIIDGVASAFQENADVFSIPDFPVLGDSVIWVLKREDWVSSLEKALVYFEQLEEYEQCKRCRDIIIKIKSTAQWPK